MGPDKLHSEKKLVRWLLLATIALLLLVLGLQLWQIFGRRARNAPAGQDASGPESLQSAAPAISHGKAAMIEDVQSLNASLLTDDLAALSAEELEQLYEAGAPGLPIGLSAAAYAAETYAGTLEMDSITWDAHPELNQSPAHYEVELHHITLGDFDYKVAAYTGEVLEGRAGLFQNIPPADEAGSASPAQVPAAQDGSGLIGEAAAKAAAFAHAGVSQADAEGLRSKLDWEDGVQVYEIEFYSGGREYEYQIEAATGAVRKAEQDWKNGYSVRGGSLEDSTFIGEEAAKAAALAHAEVSEENTGYIKWKLEEEDGVWLYEIEFLSGGLEYEYEIDAATGAVLKAGQEQ